MTVSARRLLWAATPIALAAAVAGAPPATAQDEKPNILFIMGDDIGLMQHQRLQPWGHGLSGLTKVGLPGADLGLEEQRPLLPIAAPATHKGERRMGFPLRVLNAKS